MLKFVAIEEIGKIVQSSAIKQVELVYNVDSSYRPVFPTSSFDTDAFDILSETILKTELIISFYKPTSVTKTGDEDVEDTEFVSISVDGPLSLRKTRTPLLNSVPYKELSSKQQESVNELIRRYTRAMRKKETIEQHKIIASSASPATDLAAATTYPDELVFTDEDEQKMRNRHTKITNLLTLKQADSVGTDLTGIIEYVQVFDSANTDTIISDIKQHATMILERWVTKLNPAEDGPF